VSALAAWVEQHPARAMLVFAGVLAGAVIVVLLSYGLWAIDPAQATQSHNAGSPWRFRGIGGNPNTVAMLAAAALPVAWVGVVVAKRPLARGLAGASLVLLAVELALSGSRGGIFAAVLGSAFAVGIAVPRSRVRSVAAAAGVAVVLLGFSAVVDKLLPAAGATPVAASPPAPPSWLPWYSQVGPTGNALVQVTNRSGALGDAILLPKSLGLCKPEDELGRPKPGQATSYRRTLFTSSGRGQAWVRALHEGLARPIAGYGFGSEDRVFSSCFYFFTGAHVENSYLGLFLQLGVVGVLFFAVLALALGRGLLRAARDVETRSAAAIACGAAAAALVLALVQSYFYSVGNIATLSVWLFVFVGAALGSRGISHA
jgi:O-antigen ligase